ncbi:hypothetical protein AAFP30_20765 [Gordonia sp. CPCC 205515]|uniref:hypothetical protein n=1 Tax=Gordonia sp. CPCC 205515 TaxID=3140791 RepID=UPI003AF404CF
MFSAVATGLLAAVALLYAGVTWVMIIVGGSWTWDDMWRALTTSYGSGLQRAIITCWLLSPPVFTLLLIAAMVSAVSLVARALPLLLLVPTLAILTTYFLVYVIGGHDWFDSSSPTWLYVLAWAFPLALAICCVLVFATYFFGWGFFAERKRARGLSNPTPPRPSPFYPEPAQHPSYPPPPYPYPNVGQPRQ